MGGNHSKAKRQDGSFSSWSPRSSRTDRVCINLPPAPMSASSNRSAPYPYPRSHTLFVLSPSHSGSAVSVQELSLRKPPGTFRPPLNRAIHTIPESRSNESLRTVSSISASNSKQSICLDARTPTNDACKTGFGGVQLSTTNEEVNMDNCKSAEEGNLVIENRMVSRSLDIAPDGVVPFPINTSSTPKAARSPIVRAYSRMKSNFLRRNSQNNNHNSMPSSGSSEGSVHSLNGNKLFPAKLVKGHRRNLSSDNNSNRTRTVSESVSEVGLSSVNQNGNSVQDQNANVLETDFMGKLKKTKSLEEAFRYSKRWRKKGKEKDDQESKDKATNSVKQETQPPKSNDKPKLVENPKMKDVEEPKPITKLVFKARESEAVPVSKVLPAAPEPGFMSNAFAKPPVVQQFGGNSNKAPPSSLMTGQMKQRQSLKLLDFAPLAESESSTVENSPAVEVHPEGILGVYPPGKKLPWYLRKQVTGPTPKSPLADESKSLAFPQLQHSLPIPRSSAEFRSGLAQPSTYAYSRLKHGSAKRYSAQQHVIYGQISEENIANNESQIPESVIMKKPNKAAFTSMYIDEVTMAIPKPLVVKSANSSNSYGIKSVVTQSKPVSAKRLQFAAEKRSFFSDVAAPVVENSAVNPESPRHHLQSSPMISLKDSKDSYGTVNTMRASAFTNVSPSAVNSPQKTQSVLEVRPVSGASQSPTASPSKNERHDSGVRVSGGESSASSMADSNASKVTSPSSEYRGLIDDEIRDQPELIGSSSPSLNRAEDDEVENVDRHTDLVGPVRRNSLKKRNSMMRDSLISTTSLDSEDCMLDFETSIDLGNVDESEDVMVTSTASLVMKKTGSLRRNLNRNSSVTEPGGGSKRHSMEVSLDELSHMLMKSQQSSEQDAESSQSQKDSLDASTSEMKTESRWSRGLRGSGLPILRPPPSLTKESVGQTPIVVEAHVYRSMVQDITVFKTLLHRLKGELQKADTVNPFDNGGVGDQQISNGNINTGVSVAELSAFKEDNANLNRENMELRDQMASLGQQLSERDAMIRRLQLQLQRSSSSNSPPSTSPQKGNSPS